MKFRPLTRRQFIATTLLAAPLAVWGDAQLIEPTWLAVRHLKLTSSPSPNRFVQFSDLHHKGDRAYLQKVVAQINQLNPDFICFTGDLVEDKKFLPETLEILAGLTAPVFGVPGNHDYKSGADFSAIAKCLKHTGGDWLLNESRRIVGGKINLIGMAENQVPRLPPAAAAPAKNILLMHYPFCINRLTGRKFDLILAGHSHGGQVRLPLVGPLFLPYGCDGYDLGLFSTPAGPLYVNAGIGYIGNNHFRFNCRPEITVIEI